MSSVQDWVLLSLLPGIGVRTCNILLEHFSSPSVLLAANQKTLAAIPGIRKNQLNVLRDAEKFREQAEEQVKRLQSHGGAIVTWESEQYPPHLRELVDSPQVLYCMGDVSLLNSMAIAIVGSRAATSYGRKISQRLARELAGFNVTVVSGMAHGIDAEAHTGALENKGGTVGVLGCGLDICYPKENYTLYRKIIEQGLLVSEYPLGSRPEAFRFPARNRIIAGLSRGVVVVEAARRSGSLITAQIALDCGREVFAVPGQLDSCKSEGCHWLLQQGAKLVRNGSDIISEFSFMGKGGAPTPAKEGVESETEHPELEPDAKKLLSFIEPYPLHRDVILQSSSLSAAQGAELLLILELEGCVEMLSGDRVRRVN